MAAQGAVGAYALVTGANRGLGYEVCRLLVQAGRPVIVTARSPASAEEAAGKLRALRPGAAVEWLALDAASPASAAALAAELARRFAGRQISLLVNNAGIGHMGVYTQAAHADTLATNLTGALAVTRALLPHMADGARVIMVSSGMGALDYLSPDYSQPIAAAATLDALAEAAAWKGADSPLAAHNAMAGSYSVSKAALNRATQLLAADPAFAARGVSVVAVCPGWCATDMGNAAGDNLGGKPRPPRSAAQGAEAILAAKDAAAVANGSFTRDGQPISLVERSLPPQAAAGGGDEA